ncbi:hypothetical protein [Nisaea sp.]|uniref:hypothetical protein n=1 Tax=Nisaea sp. TaxID=2024842 RepID=UPI002B26DD95|nr:hypothetical protein [Nisaea sp.]
MQKFRNAAKAFALLAVLATGACAQSPFDLIAPADLALMKTDRDIVPSDPLSVEGMLARVRGEFMPPAAETAGLPHGMSGTDFVAGAGSDLSDDITLEELRRQVASRAVDTSVPGCK